LKNIFIDNFNPESTELFQLLMNLSQDTMICIFSHVDGLSLIRSMVTCRFFRLTIDKIIREAMHHDMYEHLFQIKPLTIDILQKYLQHADNNNELANLMLAAYLSNHLEFISIIIDDAITRTRPPSFKLFDGGPDHDKRNFFKSNFIFNSIPQHKYHNVNISINFKECLVAWLFTLYNANRMDLFYRMYPNLHGYVPDKWYIFDCSSYLFSDRDIIKIDNCIKKASYHGETDLFHYDKIHKQKNYISTKLETYIIYALYGGHYTLFTEWYGRKYQSIKHTCQQLDGKELVGRDYERQSLDQFRRSFHKIIVTGLLRCNHLGHYKTYKSTIFYNAYYRVTDRHISFSDIFINLPITDTIILPLVSLDTFQLCIQEFATRAYIPQQYVSILESNICQQYTIINDHIPSRFYNLARHLNYEGRPKNHYMIYFNDAEAYLNEETIQKMIYHNELDALEYVVKYDIDYQNDTKSMDLYAQTALCAGHWELFIQLFEKKHPNDPLKKFHKMICTNLLRYNHVDLFTAYFKTIPQTNAYYQVITKRITMEDIFSHGLVINLNLPLLSLDTWEFLIKEFQMVVPLPLSNCHVGSMATEIYEKYLE